MAKMFYSLEEAAAKLGKTVDEVNAMATRRELEVFRDRDRILLKAEQVDLLAGGKAGGDDDIRLADSGELESISMASSGSGTGMNVDAKEQTGVSIFDLASDGSFAVAVESRIGSAGDRYSRLVRIDLSDGGSTVLVDEPGVEAYEPWLSPDRTRLLFSRAPLTTPELSARQELHLLDLGTGASQRVATEWDRWPTGHAWLPDSSGIILTADELLRTGTGKLLKRELKSLYFPVAR